MQVNQSYSAVLPVYLAFKAAYFRGNTADMMRILISEKTACHIADRVDQRDSINPNIKLFQASIAVDNMCNDIESAYVTWAKGHGLSFDKVVVPSLRADVFKSGDTGLKKLPGWLRHPGDLA